MGLQGRKVLYINLGKKICEIKSHNDLDRYIGGVGMGAKIFFGLEGSEEPIVFSVGPLNGFFPFAAKTSVLFKSEGSLKDVYLGGSLSTRIKYSGLDAIVLVGKLDDGAVMDITDGDVSFKPAETEPNHLGLPGKKCILRLDDFKVSIDNFFESSEHFLFKELKKKNVQSLVVTGNKTFPIFDKERYLEIYDELLGRTESLLVKKGGNPSCSGCPLGCKESKFGEEGGDLLLHSLVACKFAQPVYGNIPTVFSCLNALGYDYKHEDIENFQNVVYDLLEDLRK